jgi:hypothetical protein
MILSTAPGFDATLSGHPVFFASSPAFTALAENARVTARPLNLLVRSPATEAGTANYISRIASDDSSDAEYRPQLTVYYRGNHAPAPSVGTPPAAVAGSPVNLSGSATAADSTRWRQLSGPAAAVFADADIAPATVTFPAPGVYRLQLSATNALAETSATLEVSVVSPPSALDQWLSLHFAFPSDPEDAGMLADPDHDGIPNLIEFATGGNPTISNRAALGLAKQGAVLEFIYPRSHAAVADGFHFAVEWSDGLADGWTVTGVSESLVPDADDGTAQLWKATVPAGATSRFVRLRVTQP